MVALRILIAEDEPIHRRLLESLLTRWGYEVVIARDGAEALLLLEAEDAPRLALLDWVMPGLHGVDVCRSIRKSAARRYTYIVLLTGKTQKADIIEGIEAGADDYLTKPFDAPELKVRLNSGRRVLDLQEKLLAATEAVHKQATHDALCGIWNRAAIVEVLNRELARAARHAHPVGVILADIDHFKRVNDTCGHLSGDAVLRETAQRMRNALRSYDAIGRYGGEEFLIIAPGLPFESAAPLAERIRLAVAHEAVRFDASSVSVSLSLGVAISGELQDAHSLLQAADAALYRAKAAGRNRFEIAPLSPAPLEHASPGP